MNTDQKTALVDAHWSYIEKLLRAYNELVGCHPEANLRVIETDYKEAMRAGLDGLECRRAVTTRRADFMRIISLLPTSTA